jgi:hypothetical protein
MDIQFLRCSLGNEHTWTHGVIHDTFVAITQNASFHVGQKQLHAFLSNTFNPFRWQVNIAFTKDGIRTLADVVIIDPMRVDLFPQSCAIQRFVVSNVAQTKKRSYCEWHPNDQFFTLVIEVFGCLHK